MPIHLASKSTPFAGATHQNNNTASAKWTPAKIKILLKPSLFVFFYMGVMMGSFSACRFQKNHRVQGTCNAYTVASNTYPDPLKSDLYVPGSSQTPRDLNTMKTCKQKER